MAYGSPWRKSERRAIVYCIDYPAQGRRYWWAHQSGGNDVIGCNEKGANVYFALPILGGWRVAASI
jgi:hypothetical protein